MKKFRVFSKGNPIHVDMYSDSINSLLAALIGTDVEAVYDERKRVWQSW